MNRRPAQAAVEYLTIYGIAILIIILAIGYFYYVAGNPQSKLPNSCTFASGAPCSDLVIGTNSVSHNSSLTVLIGKSGSSPITSPYAKVNINGANTSWFPCLPNYVGTGGLIICNVNLTFSNSNLKLAVGQTVSGSIYLEMGDCGVSGSISCKNPPTEESVGKFEGTVQAGTQAFNPRLSFNNIDLEPVTANITVGNRPIGVFINPTGSFAYVPNVGSDTVSVINMTYNKVVATIPVGAVPEYVAFSPTGSMAIVCNLGGGTVSIIDTATSTVVNTLPTGDEPDFAVFAPSGNLAYVSEEASTAYIIDPSTATIVNTITLPPSGGGPQPSIGFVAINPQGTLAYLTSVATGQVFISPIGSNVITSNVAVGSNPSGVTFNPSGTLGYVPSRTSGISVIDEATNMVVNTISSYGAGAVTFSPSGSLAYVPNIDGSTVNVINVASNSLQSSINVQKFPDGVAVNPQGTIGFVSNSGSNSVSILNLVGANVISNVYVGAAPSGVTVNTETSFAYIPDYGGNTVSAINLAALEPNSRRNSITVQVTLNGVPLQGATVNFTSSNPYLPVAPQYVTTDSDGEATTFISSSLVGSTNVYASLNGAIIANYTVAFG